MPSPRSAALTAVFATVMLLIAPGAARWSSVAQAHSVLRAPSAARTPSTENVDKLRKQADKAKEDLAKATHSWEQRRKQLNSSEAKLKQTLADLGAADAEMKKIREPLARLAAIAYKQPGVIGVPALVSGGDPYEALRGTTDLSMLSGSQQTLIRKADGLRQQREKLAGVAQNLQSRNALEQTRLQQEITRLKSRADALTKQLTAALKKLDPSTRLQLTCKKSLVSRAREFPNGLIPSRYLCPLPQKGRSLRADAALAFYRLNRAYKARFGVNMCLTDAYRPLAEQQRIYANRPGMAAVPGKSNHGWGTAVDLCGGVQNQGSAQFGWLEANAKKYEWFHPSWAYSSPFEPWHWEYTKENTPNS